MKKEFFEFLHLKFDITKAKRLIKSYEIEAKKPSLDWILPLVSINEDYVPKADLNKSIIFATLPMDNKICHYLIDGNHAVKRAISEGVPLLNTVTLTVADSLSILKSPKQIRDSFRSDAYKLGLL